MEAAMRDTVTILSAVWRLKKSPLGILLIEAKTTQSGRGATTLTVNGLHTMDYTWRTDSYYLKLKKVPYPGNITVHSSLGGIATTIVVMTP